jgi:hypothetical protein
MKRIFILILAAAAIGGSCKKDETREEPSLQVTAPAVLEAISETSSIEAVHTAGSYTIIVMSNATWTATVETATLWCTASPASGTGNSAVRIDVEENPAPAPRSATIAFAAGTLTRTVTVTQNPQPATPPAPTVTPPHAASTQTWTLGAQTWSDAIHMPGCNKQDFVIDYTNPQCRSYTSGTNIWYYYNWIYVNANKAAMCPDPWRVPTCDDFTALSSTAASARLIDAWGFGGFVRPRTETNAVETTGTYGYYWSSTETSATNACYLTYSATSLNVGTGFAKELGRQARCVR